MNTSLPASPENDGPGDHVAAAPIGVLLCDDHHILSDALALIIGMDPALQLLAAPFDRAAPALAAVAALGPDVVIMDVELPGDMSGIEATRAITALSPTTKVIVMSGTGDPNEMLVQAVEAGAAGFLAKTQAASSLLAAIHTAAAGESLLDTRTLSHVLRQVAETRAARRVVNQHASRLSNREREILQLVSQGESNEDIAENLCLSIHTVHTHVRNILLKLEVHSKLQAVAWAVRTGEVVVKR